MNLKIYHEIYFKENFHYFLNHSQREETMVLIFDALATIKISSCNANATIHGIT